MAHRLASLGIQTRDYFRALHLRSEGQALPVTERLTRQTLALPFSSELGTGRWAQRLVELGHTVIGVEKSPAMAGIARGRVAAERFRLIEALMDRVELAAPVDVVLAMGSLQYAPHPERALAHMVGWLRPGGGWWCWSTRLWPWGWSCSRLANTTRPSSD